MEPNLNNLPSLGLFTDYYELLMAQVYVERELFDEATFSLFIRKKGKRNFFLCCGLSTFLELLPKFRFSESDLEYLESLGVFSQKFLDFLKNFRFKGEIKAFEEGRFLFPHEPICEVTSSLPVCQLLETFILNVFHIETLVATKALLSVLAAEEISCVDFSARRTHGICAALHVAKASYVAGFKATSNVLAGKLWKIPLTGTMAHSFIEVFEKEEEAFKTYLDFYPQNTILLIDTYDTIRAAKKLAKSKEKFKKIKGVRIDSGDLASLTKEVREIFDKEGLRSWGVFLSGGIDETKIRKIKKQGVPVTGFGVGTYMGVSADEPYLDITYKLVEYKGVPKTKLSPGKKYYPGKKEVYRVYREGKPVRDVIALEKEILRLRKYDVCEKLTRIVWQGERPLLKEPLEVLRKRAERDRALFKEYINFENFKIKYPVRISSGLRYLYQEIVKEIQKELS